VAREKMPASGARRQRRDQVQIASSGFGMSVMSADVKDDEMAPTVTNELADYDG
jgi:hypothetical protein